MFFDDLPVGFRFETASRTVPLEEILEFARKWDPQPFHIDPEAARESPYGGIIASGFHTILVSFVLTLDSKVWAEASLGSPGMENIRWLAPVRPGDRLHLVGEVIASRVSASRPDRGLTTIRHEVINQDATVVAEYTTIQILRRAPSDGMGTVGE